MKRLIVSSTIALLALACTTTEKAPADTAAPAAATGSQTSDITLADVAGNWNMRAMPIDRDTTLLNFTVMATADTSGWMMHLPNRPAVGMRVSAAGDSIVGEAGPYQAVLRKNAMSTTRSVFRLQEGRLVGVTEVRYSNLPDSVVRLRMEGTRAP